MLIRISRMLITGATQKRRSYFSSRLLVFVTNFYALLLASGLEIFKNFAQLNGNIEWNPHHSNQCEKLKIRLKCGRLLIPSTKVSLNCVIETAVSKNKWSVKYVAKLSK